MQCPQEQAKLTCDVSGSSYYSWNKVKADAYSHGLGFPPVYCKLAWVTLSIGE